MQVLRILSLGLCLSAFTGACSSDDGDDAESSAALTAPANLKVSTVDGKPHLTWSDTQNEDHYMVERMDHAAGSAWVTLKNAENLVVNTTQYHDSSAVAGATYMYRIVAMKGQSRAVSNEVTWP